MGVSPAKNSISTDLDNDKSRKGSKLGPHSPSSIKVLLAETWNDSIDPVGYYMSEKLDGVRCFWTGTRMLSREGNQFFPPRFFTENWPNSQMDGELFINRGRFSETISAIKKKSPIDEEWQKVCYLVFDAPGLKKPFRERVELMEEVIGSIDSPYLKCHSHRICTGFDDLFKELDEVNKVKGEGLMLRNPESFYENRRSKSLLKVKTFHDDEATILGFKKGTGRCEGMVGALQVRNTHGIEFDIGSGLNDAMRRKPPKIGTLITYKYQEFIEPSKKPRFPVFLRIYQPL